VVFEVQIELSDDGFAHYQEVIRLAHDYICMLQRTGPSERVFHEAQAINQLHFRFRERQDPATYAHRLARNVHKYPAEGVLVGESAPEPFDPELLRAFGDILANGQPRVFLSSKDHDGSAEEGWHVEKWYGTEYQVKSLAELGIVLEGRPNAELALPSPNEFLPSAFDVLVKPGLTEGFAVPHLVKSSALKLWHKVDDQFEVPKVNVNLLFRSPLVRQSAKSVALLHLFTELVKEELNAVAYPADTAGLKYDIGLL
jgi:insulysin